MASPSSATNNATPSDPSAATAQLTADEQRAAGVIQRNYRGHRERRQMKGLGLDPSTRWMEAVKEAQYRALTKPHARSASQPQPNTPLTSTTPSLAKQNWRRVGQIAMRAGSDDGPDPEDSLSSSLDSDSPVRSKNLTPEEKQARRERRIEARKEREKTAKMMDLQYFLEMVDVKHRYGSNLRTYHNYWKTAKTNENFFYWLDYGEGKDIELPTCTRERLDKNQVRYLSREERLRYLVRVDGDGKLRWAKNDAKISTDSKRFRDSMDGIVPLDDTGPTFTGTGNHNSESSEDSDSSDEEAERYVNHDLDAAKGLKKIAYVSPATIFNHLMRHSIKGGKHGWIFVADTSFRLYVGIKQSGSFQHSSFLHGSRISSAGLIKIKDGQLRSLSPLSGHYRPPAANFRTFVHSLKEAGVDMSRVRISKSYAVLVGIESYQKSKKRVKSAKEAIAHTKDKVLHPEKVKAEEEEARDKSQSAEKERLHLQKIREEEIAQQKGLPHRVKDGVLKLTSRENVAKEPAPAEGTPIENRGIGGTGPEDGVPAPEGKR